MLKSADDRPTYRKVLWWQGLTASLEGDADLLSHGFAPAFDVGEKTFRYGLAFLLLLSAISQYVLFSGGLYAICADESSRTLAANDLSFSHLLSPSFWPPVTKILMGLPLLVHHDLFLTPRIEVGLMGLVCLCALAFLTWQLFENRLMALVALALGIMFPQRLILAVVPLSDMYGYVFSIFAAGFVAGWLRRKQVSDLTAASIFFMIGTGIRLEIWFISACYGFYLIYALLRREISIPVFLLNGVLISILPIGWLLAVYLHDGGLQNLTIVKSQFTNFYGHNYKIALRTSVLYRILKEILIGPALAFGALTLAFQILRDRTSRAWAIIFFAPALIETVYMLATFSVPIGEEQRTAGIWVLLLLPFCAFAVVTLVTQISPLKAVRAAILVLATYGLIVPLALHTAAELKMFDLYKEPRFSFSQDDLVLGKQLKTLLRDDNGQILLDAMDNLSYLNIAVASNAPERFVLNVDEDFVTTGLFVTSTNTEDARADSTIVETYLSDKFLRAGVLDIPKLKARQIHYILSHSDSYSQALEATGAVERMNSVGSWTLFRFKA